MQFYRIISAAALLGAVSLASVQTSTAAPLMAMPGIGQAAANVETVQYRRWHGGGYRRYGGYRGGGYGTGAAVIGGLAAGAIIGGAIASSQAANANASYCAQRFRSYDPGSGTYLGNDGFRHPCP